jgi:hypothetical protein
MLPLKEAPHPPGKQGRIFLDCDPDFDTFELKAFNSCLIEKLHSLKQGNQEGRRGFGLVRENIPGAFPVFH